MNDISYLRGGRESSSSSTGIVVGEGGGLSTLSILSVNPRNSRMHSLSDCRTVSIISRPPFTVISNCPSFKVRLTPFFGSSLFSVECDRQESELYGSLGLNSMRNGQARIFAESVGLYPNYSFRSSCKDCLRYLAATGRELWLASRPAARFSWQPAEKSIPPKTAKNPFFCFKTQEDNDLQINRKFKLSKKLPLDGRTIDWANYLTKLQNTAGPTGRPAGTPGSAETGLWNLWKSPKSADQNFSSVLN
jgi:hypothetical protein